jgi:FkbM family methyltransferase
MQSLDLERELRELLAEGRDAAVERERTAFDRLTRERPLVLYGAGGLGRKALAALQKQGIQPLAFADNNSKLWGTSIAGIPVMAPADAAARFGATAAFVITIWGGESPDTMVQRVKQVQALGCDTVVTIGPLFWKLAAALLPHYAAGPAHEVHEDTDDVLNAGALWADEASRREYLAQVRWRLYFDFENLAPPVTHVMYFPPDLFALRPDEVFVDCGAFDGDTIASYLAHAKAGFGKIIAFEPDPANFAKLERRVSALAERDSVRLLRAATGADNLKVRFSGDGKSSSAVGSGDIEVDCFRLDDVLQGEPATYLKMDIEGAEIDTLLGAEHTIRQYCPVLAICCYHRQDHLWRIPNLIQSFHSDYHFFLRPHFADVWDLVCYAVPKGRLL